MKLNRQQSAIALIGAVLILLLVLFPPWQQAAEKEVDYRKDLGRSFVLTPPPSIAVDCYFVGCKTAPPSYFHVLLKRDFLIAECLCVFVVSVGMVWIFRQRKDGTQGSIRDGKTRAYSSVLLSLLIPIDGTVPLGLFLSDVPRMLIRREDLWLMPAIMIVVLCGVCSLAIYGLLTLAVKISVIRTRTAPQV
jgi:hypothetical protein